MFSSSTWLHLRIPFSYFLLPVFIFAVGISPNHNASRLFWVFIIVHFLLYPASNGYNSYFDKDEKSIGGLKNPPLVNRGLYFLSLLFDLLAVTLGWLKINWQFGAMLLIYGLVSKSYSHPSIRLKKYPFVGWIVTGLFQGSFTLFMCYVGINDFEWQTALNPKVLWAGAATTLMLWGNYPMTQIYQHEEDSKRGDITMSIKLGVSGTFHFTALSFGIATAGFVFFFENFYDIKYGISFFLFLAPVVAFFLYWYFKTRLHPVQANYQNTMWLNFIAATCLNVFFIYFFLDSSSALNFF
jgi:1,4-dihydroxy-2-naphthoate octaprenyltransferase